MFVPNISTADVQNVKAMSRADRDALEEKIKSADPCSVFTPAGKQPRNSDKRWIICPNCGNGEGSDHTPVEATRKDGVWLYNCFRCNDFHGNLFGIIATDAGLNPKGNFDDFCKALAIGAKLIGDYVPDAPAQDSKRKLTADDKKAKKKAEQTAYCSRVISYAQQHLKNFMNKQHGDWRGLTLETLQHFKCGFMEQWHHFKKPSIISPRVIIPASYNVADANYLARLTVPLESIKDTSRLKYIQEKEHDGEKTLFNPLALRASDPVLVVVEGYIDAMTLWQAFEGKISVVALGGKKGGDLILNEVKALTGKKILVLFDYDDKGEGKDKGVGDKLRGDLIKAGIPATCKFFDDFMTDEDKQGVGDKIDANAILVKLGSDKLKAVTESIIAAAQDDFTAIEKDVARERALNQKLSEWQKINGAINPEVLPEIKAAAEYLAALTVDDITADIALSSKTVRAVSLCTAYDLNSLATNFFAILNDAKNAAKKRMKDAESELTAPLEPSERLALGALIQGVDVRSLRDRIDREVKALAKSHKEFVKSEKQRKVREEAEAARAAHAAEMTNLQARLETLKSQQQCPERDAAIVDTIRQLCKWKHDKLGNPVSVEANQANADLIFGSDPDIAGLVGYNEFSDANEFLKSPPWSKDIQRGDDFKDADEDRLAVFLRRSYTDFGNKELLSQNVTELSRVNQFNPVKEYFKSLPDWDGKSRAETLFIDWLAVEDTPFVREVTSKILLAAVARIFHPGCTFQNAVVLHGNQKIGKGYILERLGGQWYKAISDNVDDPHAVDAIRVTWLAEFKEMKGLSRAANDAIKEFIELPADTRRFAYERHARTVKRHCVFFLSVNDDEFLSDLTGNRRFWILHSPLPKFGWQPEVRGERLSDDNVVKQIWAEVYAKYQELFKDGFDERKLTLSREAEIAGEEIAEQYVRSDGGVEGIIRNFVDTKIPDSVIWSLLSREQRREFYVKGGMITLYRDDLLAKRRARGGRNESDDVSKINQLCTSSAKKIDDGNLYAFYGTEYRQHICAAEVRDECFDKTDKRANPTRIGEILKRLEGWTLGKRIARDSVYGNQPKVYWRDADNIPTDDEPADSPPPKKDYVDDLGGEPIDPTDMPF